MRKIYGCNERGMIHIYNETCNHSKTNSLKTFDTEEEARKYAGVSAHFCKTCVSYRDKKLREIIKKEMERKEK